MRSNNVRSFGAFTVFTFLVLAALLGCSGGGDMAFEDNGKPPLSPSEKASIAWATVQAEVIGPRCIRCHDSSDRLPLNTYPLVLSKIDEIKRAVLIERTMPKNGALSSREFAILEAWIEAGAPEQRVPPSTPTPQPSPTPTVIEPTFDSINQHVFSRRCVSCHSEGGRAEHIPLTSKEEILDSPRELVIPGNADESGIVLAIERPDEKRMPPPPRSPLTPDEMRVIREWITNGAVD